MPAVPQALVVVPATHSPEVGSQHPLLQFEGPHFCEQAVSSRPAAATASGNSHRTHFIGETLFPLGPEAL
jgi:hypothetical protein